MSEDSLGRYLKSLSNYGRITKEREIELSEIIQSDANPKDIEKAVDELVEANLALVVSRATKYSRSYRGPLTIMDFIAEGNMGLMKAASSFDTSKDSSASFSTYAVFIIDDKIRKMMKDDKLIHIPSHHRSYKIRLNHLQEDYGAYLTDAIILDELQISKRFLSRLRAGIELGGVKSLEDMKDGDGESIWADIVEDKDGVDPTSGANKEILGEYLDKYLDKLTSQEQEVIKFMFFENIHSTYAEIGKEMNLSLERVRQIYLKAMRKLKVYMTKHLEVKDEIPRNNRRRGKYHNPVENFKTHVNEGLINNANRIKEKEQ